MKVLRNVEQEYRQGPYAGVGISSGGDQNAAIFVTYRFRPSVLLSVLVQDSAVCRIDSCDIPKSTSKGSGKVEFEV